LASKVFLVQSEGLGRGDEKLGKILMTSFLRLLAANDDKPKTMLFWNKGVRLLCEQTEALGYLIKLQGQGVEILGCTTCMEYFGLVEKMKVGKMTTMVKAVESMLNSEMVCL
jgi:selenium metabolism protein YedF